MAEKLNNFEKFERKKNQISALFSTQTPPDEWPDALDCLAIGLDANKCTKLGKLTKKLLLKPPLPSTVLVLIPNILMGGDFYGK